MAKFIDLCKCPFCGSFDNELGEIQTEIDTTAYVSRDASCMDCDNKWVMHYHLVRLEDEVGKKIKEKDYVSI